MTLGFVKLGKVCKRFMHYVQLRVECRSNSDLYATVPPKAEQIKISEDVDLLHNNYRVRHINISNRQIRVNQQWFNKDSTWCPRNLVRDRYFRVNRINETASRWDNG